MKLKKKHFKRLKEIAVAVNQVFPGTGVRLDKLIAEIESVQKLPVEDLIYAMHRKDVKANILKEGEAMVAASTDEGTEFKGGLRAQMKQYETLPGEGLNPIHQALKIGLQIQKELIDKSKSNKISNLLDDALVLSNKDPKIGDVGYFWDNDINGVYYCILKEIKPNGDYVARTSLGTFNHFSKTPPELK